MKRGQNQAPVEKKTWYKLRDAVVRLAIEKFESISGFECSVGMMEDLILILKTDLFDYKLLANSYTTMANIFAFQNDFQEKLRSLNEEQRKKAVTSRENILKPQYFCIKFGNISAKSRAWMRFLSGKTFVYRGDTTLRYKCLLCAKYFCNNSFF